ncbi:dTMP kinase [Candidatus Saccharibacteria bacterium]|nr:dTMP kinase [Candidatus Saccharibacteria bacterium]MCB9821504.1 dTMP kinase [Candidatus Nomurabacteria bacterium]
MTERGLYIVIEGGQGVGKTTQASMLAQALTASGMSVKIMREPDSQTDAVARQLRRLTQNPEYDLSKRTEVLLYNAARSQSLDKIKMYVDNGIVCIVDRNYISTLINQYYLDADKPLDYSQIDLINSFATEVINPDVLLILDAPVEMLVQRKQSADKGERFDNLSSSLLENARSGYLQEAKNRNIPVIDASRPTHDVHQEIVTHVQYAINLVGDKQVKQSVPVAATLRNESEISIGTISNPKTDHKHNLSDVVTDTKSNIYAITENLSPTTAAAAMARLSRRGDDMRTILVDEFLDQKGSDSDLLRRVITAYGDDSVQQLNGLHVVVERASNLLTKKIEWGRLAAYLEQSTRYIFYDQKDADGKYKYFTPQEITDGFRELYITTLDSIFDRYSQIVRELYEYVQNNSQVPKKEQDAAWKSACRAQACDAARGLLPVATTSTVGIYASAQSYDNMIMRLLADPTAEARHTGQKILEEVRKLAPAFFERTDQPGKGASRSNYQYTNSLKMRQHAQELPLPTELPEDIQLTSYWPHNELEIVPHMLYSFSDLSESAIVSEISQRSYDEKTRIFEDYIGERLNRRMKPGRAFERISYSFDIVSDYGAFRDLQRHRIVSDLEWQELTPKYGFDIPELVEKAGLSDIYESCFDDSAMIYSKLFEEYGSVVAQYVTLLGHRMRWKLTVNAREAFHFIELRSSPQGHRNYRRIAQKMHQLISDVHPLTAGAMIFVNKDEDPELTRLAAEKYTQSKLAKLQDTKH